MPEDMPDRMPEDMPEGMPDRMPDKMSDKMSNRMPEDLPVTKCINVMVGITRSKVFFLLGGLLPSTGVVINTNLALLCFTEDRMLISKNEVQSEVGGSTPMQAGGPKMTPLVRSHETQGAAKRTIVWEDFWSQWSAACMKIMMCIQVF